MKFTALLKQIRRRYGLIAILAISCSKEPEPSTPLGCVPIEITTVNEWGISNTINYIYNISGISGFEYPGLNGFVGNYKFEDPEKIIESELGYYFYNDQGLLDWSSNRSCIHFCKTYYTYSDQQLIDISRYNHESYTTEFTYVAVEEYRYEINEMEIFLSFDDKKQCGNPCRKCWSSSQIYLLTTQRILF